VDSLFPNPRGRCILPPPAYRARESGFGSGDPTSKLRRFEPTPVRMPRTVTRSEKVAITMSPIYPPSKSGFCDRKVRFFFTSLLSTRFVDNSARKACHNATQCARMGTHENSRKIFRRFQSQNADFASLYIGGIVTKTAQPSRLSSTEPSQSLFQTRGTSQCRMISNQRSFLT
jgi:hypothetical protein